MITSIKFEGFNPHFCICAVTNKGDVHIYLKSSLLEKGINFVEKFLMKELHQEYGLMLLDISDIKHE